MVNGPSAGAVSPTEIERDERDQRDDEGANQPRANRHAAP